LYAIYIAIIQLCAISFTLKYELAIPLEKIAKKRISLFTLSILNMLFMIGLFFVFIKLFLISYPNNQLNHILNFLPLGIAFQTLFNHVIYHWLLFKKEFRLISSGKIIFASIYSFFPIIIFYTLDLKDYKYIIISHQIGLFLSIITTSFILYNKNIFLVIKKFFKVKFSNLKSTFVDYKKYTLFSTPSHLMNSLGIWLPAFFIWFFLDDKYVALFFISHRMINAPVLLVGQSIGKIFYSEASESQLKGKLNVSIIKYFKLLFHTALPFLFICIFLIDDIFSFIFNDNWLEIGKIIKIFSPWLFLVFIASPLSTIPTILYKQEYEFRFQFTLLIVRFFALSIGSFLGDIYFMFIIFSLANVIVWFFYLLIIFKISNIRIYEILNACVEDVLEHSIIFIIILLINIFFVNPAYTLIGSLLIVIYLFYSFYNKVIKSNFEI
tara:strand:+ start:3726 stop:5039 length:1314 start_codon:yes stop_codon:yes gene_type:complete